LSEAAGGIPRRVVIAAAMILVVLVVFWLAPPMGQSEEIPLSEFLGSLRSGEVQSIDATGSEWTVEIAGQGSPVEVRVDEGTSVRELLQDEGVDPASLEVTVSEPRGGIPWLQILLSLLPVLLIGGVLLFFLSRAMGMQTQLGSRFSRSGAELAPSRPDVTFDDVAGLDEAKEELLEIVEFLRNPERFRALGAHVPKGVLLVGAPGTGKTYVARAVAGEAGVPFHSISGSQFVEMFVGVGAARVRDLFRQAKEDAPSIIFIDELDAAGRQRGAGVGGGHDEREQTLNQILVELDGFTPNTNVIVLGATNRPDILDPALVPPGRFDRRVVLDRPDLRGREAILGVHARGKPLAPEVDLNRIAAQTVGLVGADLANLLNEAALLAARRTATEVTQGDIEEALDRVLAGPQRKSRVMSVEERRRVAVHEGGHALVDHYLPHADPVAKVSIVPRGVAGGYTRMAPEEEHLLITREELRDRLAVFLGGRVAEELFLDDISTGAEDDIQAATRLARQMVTRWGMSEKLGPLGLGREPGQIFLGRELAEQRDYSEGVAERVDSEVAALVGDAERRAREILEAHRESHCRTVELLLERETLSGRDLELALGGEHEGGTEPPGPAENARTDEGTVAPTSETAS